MTRDEQGDVLKSMVILCKEYFTHIHIQFTKPLSVRAVALFPEFSSLLCLKVNTRHVISSSLAFDLSCTFLRVCWIKH